LQKGSVTRNFETVKCRFWLEVNPHFKMTGKIARVTDRGFGFITPDEGDKDVFFHAKDLVEVEFDELQEGDAVTFDIEEGPKGPAAANVQKA